MFTERVQLDKVNGLGRNAMRTQEDLILHAARQALKRTTGLDARIHAVRAAKDGADAILEVAVNRGKRRFRAEVKAVDRFEIPALIKARNGARRAPPLLVAPYITREVAERCRQLRLAFIDTAGNAYLEAPGLFVFVVGNNKPAEFRQERFRALNPAGLQIAFALACRPGLIQTTQSRPPIVKLPRAPEWHWGPLDR
jgi:hypothetical protein